MAAAQYFEQVQKIFIAFYQRPADPAGLKYWAQRVDAAGGDFGAVIDAFAASPEAVALYVAIDATTIGDVIDKLYLALFNTAPDAAGKQFYIDGFTAGTYTAGTIALNVLNGATGDDAVAVANKVQVANNFTQQVDGRPLTDAYFGSGTSFNVTYAGDADAQAARDILKGVTFNASTVLNPSQVTEQLKAKIADATDPIIGQTGGQTFTLTNGIDNIVGTSGNDTIIGDNTQTGAAGPGDQIDGGAGTDLFKLYIAAATAVDTLTLPQLKNVEQLYIKGGTLTNAQTANYSAIAGLNSVELDSAAALVDATNFTVKTTAAQTVKLSNVNAVAAGTTATVALSDATALGLNGVGTDTTATGVVRVDLASTTATSATLAATGAASKVTLLNSAAKVSTLTITGDQNLTLTEGLTTLKTINASAATGKIAVDASAITVDAAFAFTGGSGADTLTLSEAGLNALTAGSQLNGGAGTDTLKINLAASAYTAADYKAINAATSFEILGLGTAAGDTVDASQLTSIKEFAVYGGTNVITKAAAGSTLDILGGTTKTTVSGAVGVTDLAINIGSATATTATTNTALDVTGLTNVTINSSIKAGTVGASHVIGTLTASENSSFTIKGNGDLTLALATGVAAPVTTGSKVDGSAATGILTVTANGATFNAAKTSLGDVIIGGSGNDVLKAGLNSTILTGNAGNDTFDVSTAVVAATTGVINQTVITDFNKGDSLKVTAAFTATNSVVKADLSSLAAGQTDVQIATVLATKALAAGGGDLVWGTYNGNTYVLEDIGTAKTFDAADILVKLTGTLDLSTSTHTVAGTLIFA